ncbi:MAG: hypothetical protein Tsb006_3810 [Rickettsiaceae bacterium]
MTLLALSGCYAVETTSRYNSSFTWAKSQSKPIYLSFRDTKSTPFYFLLSKDSKQNDYKLTVRWRNSKAGDILFNGFDTTLKFLVNQSRIFTFKPISRPKIVAYNINSRSHEEEGIFAISPEQFKTIANAKNVTVEITGRNNTVSATFNNRNTFRAFRDFAETSH